MKKNIVAVGDSITWGFPYGPDWSWVNILARELPDWNWINQGLNGDTFEGILTRLEEDVIQERPVYCILTAGINDVFMGCKLKQIQLNVEKIVSSLKENMIIPIIGIPINILEEIFQPELNELQLWLEDFAQSGSFTRIDFRGLNQMDFGDEVHPNQTGYKKMGEQALWVMRKLLENKA